MKHQFLALIALSVFSSATWAAGELSCKKKVVINETEGYQRTCTYRGSSLHEAYQSYREVTGDLAHAPETLPNQNRKLKYEQDEFNAGEVVIKWNGKNAVSVTQEDTNVGGGVEVSFKKSGSHIQIQELGWTP